MKRLLWFSRGEKPIIEIVLDETSAQWLADHLPRDDRAHIALLAAIDEASRDTSIPNETESHT